MEATELFMPRDVAGKFVIPEYDEDLDAYENLFAVIAALAYADRYKIGMQLPPLRSLQQSLLYDVFPTIYIRWEKDVLAPGARVVEYKPQEGSLFSSIPDLTDKADCIVLCGDYKHTGYFEACSGLVKRFLGNVWPDAMKEGNKACLSLGVGSSFSGAPVMIAPPAYIEESVQAMPASIDTLSVVSPNPRHAVKYCVQPFDAMRLYSVEITDYLHMSALKEAASYRTLVCTPDAFSWWAAWIGHEAGKNIYVYDRWLPNRLREGGGLHIPGMKYVSDGNTSCAAG